MPRMGATWHRPQQRRRNNDHGQRPAINVSSTILKPFHRHRWMLHSFNDEVRTAPPPSSSSFSYSSSAARSVCALLLKLMPMPMPPIVCRSNAVRIDARRSSVRLSMTADVFGRCAAAIRSTESESNRSRSAAPPPHPTPPVRRATHRPAPGEGGARDRHAASCR